MAELRILIVDDEPLARRGIRQMLAAEADVVVLDECRNGREAVEALQRLNPDLVFLDVQMPDLNGFGVIREYGIERMPPVVFVTAHDEFAVQAFEAHALDYLVKPLHAVRFAQTMARVRERQKVGMAMQLVSQLSALLGAGNPTATAARQTGPGRRYDTRVVIPTTTGDRIVEVGTIDWVEADDYYARLHVGRVQYLLRESLSRLARRLDPAAFARVHRSAIVRLDSVREIQGSRGRTVLVLRGMGPGSASADAERRRFVHSYGGASTEQITTPVPNLLPSVAPARVRHVQETRCRMLRAFASSIVPRGRLYVGVYPPTAAPC